MQGYQECIVCGCNTLIPWSDLFRDEFEIPNGTLVCSEKCYNERMAEEAEYRGESLTNR